MLSPQTSGRQCAVAVVWWGCAKVPRREQCSGRGCHHLPGSYHPRWRSFGPRSSLFPWAFLWDLIVQPASGSGPNLGNGPLHASPPDQWDQATLFWPGQPGSEGPTWGKGWSNWREWGPKGHLRGLACCGWEARLLPGGRRWAMGCGGGQWAWERTCLGDASFMQERETTPHPPQDKDTHPVPAAGQQGRWLSVCGGQPLWLF